MIVWLASYPRSGNTFFRMLLHQYYGIKSYSVYNDPDIAGIGAADVVGHIEMTTSIEKLKNDAQIHFVKTHDFPSDDSPAIYLVRDGRDALVSHARYLMKFHYQTDNPVRRLKQIIGWENFQRMLRNVIITSGWSNHILEWNTRRENSKIQPVKFEELLKNPELVLRQSVEQLEIDLNFNDSKQMPKFESLKQQWPEFFRKGKKGSWQEEMPEKLHRLFWDHHAEGMELFSYLK